MAKFTWDAWDFDCDGEAYVISKRECPNKDDVPDYICKVDHITPECKPEMVVQKGIAKWQVRTDWENLDGEPRGGYFVNLGGKLNTPNRGWFEVWIVRKDEWY